MSRASSLGTGPHLLRLMAPLYRDLYSSPAPCTPYTPTSGVSSWMTTDLKVGKQGPDIFIPLQARVLEYGGRRVFTKTDLPGVPRSSKPQYIRASNPESSTTSLQKDSKKCLDWLMDILQLRVAPAGGPTMSHLARRSRRPGRRRPCRHWWVDGDLELRGLVRGDVDDLGAPTLLALPHQESPDIHRLFRDVGTTGSHSGCTLSPPLPACLLQATIRQ